MEVFFENSLFFYGLICWLINCSVASGVSLGTQANTQEGLQAELAQLIGQKEGSYAILQIFGAVGVPLMLVVPALCWFRFNFWWGLGTFVVWIFATEITRKAILGLRVFKIFYFLTPISFISGLYLIWNSF